MDIEDRNWEKLPQDGGQIIEVSYSADYENGLMYMRMHDKNIEHIKYYSAVLIQSTENDDYQPQNGILPKVGNWKELED